MPSLTRRRFLEVGLSTSAVLAAAPRVVAQASRARIRGANQDLRLAVIGIGGKGTDHIKRFSQIPGVRIVAVCDADRDHAAAGVEYFKKHNQEVKSYTDLRRIMDDPEIDAITTATPNHWHSLVGIWACQAGKDAFVEKPVSHNIWEGRKLVEAARKYDRIVACGTHGRSCTGLRAAMQYIHEGNLGKVTLARGFCYKRRESIGKVDGPQPIPAGVDYDLWSGPAPLEPLMRKRLHYDWHWVWPTGNGDIGNQGIHEMDQCRWALGEKGLAPRVLGIGGRFGYDDDATTPNTQIAFFDYQPAPLIFEVRGLPRATGQDAMDNYRGTRVGIVIECEGGYFAGGTGGGWVYDKDGKRVKQFDGDGGGGHFANFIKAVRSRKREDLNAEIEDGHLSSALCHMGNISYRLGNRCKAEEVQEHLKQPVVEDAYQRLLAHLEANQVTLARAQVVLGPPLSMDAEHERFDDAAWSVEANAMASSVYRPPFVVPENV